MQAKVQSTHTWTSDISKDRFNHGSDLILPDGSQGLKPLMREELQCTHLPDLHVVRPIIGPYEVLAISAELSR